MENPDKNKIEQIINNRNNMEIIIRRIEENDFPQMALLFSEFAAFQNMPERMTNSLERMKKEKDFIFGFVAVTEDNAVIGYATCFFAYYTWTGKSLYMDDLFVKQKYRGKGVGTRLLENVIDLARYAQCHKLRWQVSHWNNRAQQFYKNMGAVIDDIEFNCDLALGKS